MGHHKLQFIVSFEGDEITSVLEKSYKALDMIREITATISIHESFSMLPEWGMLKITGIPDPDKKIQAVKEVRRLLGLGLKESKELVEGFSYKIAFPQGERLNTKLRLAGFQTEYKPMESEEIPF